MSQTNLADPDIVAESDQEVIDVPDDSAAQSAGNKRAPGRPASDAWNNFKRIPNPNPGNSKRKYLGVCKDCGQKVTAKPEDLRRHASNCTKSSIERGWPLKCNRSKQEGEEIAASFLLTAIVTAASFPKAITRRLLVLAIVMCGIPFACFVCNCRSSDSRGTED